MAFSIRKKVFFVGVWIGLIGFLGAGRGLAQQRIPREYTNPGEQVTFDRTTSFKRAIDVLNNFSNKYAGKAIINRSQVQGNLGITVPPMQWRDALDLILEANNLKLVGHRKYYEIVPSETHSGLTQPAPSRPDTALSTDSKEVRINAIFFEGNRSALQEVGVDWSSLTNNVPANVGQFVNQNGNGGGGGGGGSGGGGAGGSNNGQLPSQFQGPFVSVNAKGAQSVSQNVFNALINFGQVFGTGISVQALFSAFQADNLGKILASPSVRVLNGQEGHIQVGQDFSIKQRDFAGNVTDKFFSVGTILNVTPHVIEREDTTFIHLDIEAEKSSAQPDPVSTVINKQNASTQALLLNHEATVIAGLYRTETTKVRRGIPILKDLPKWFFGLPYLFGYNSTTYKTRELVILIQASIVPDIPQRMRKTRLEGKFEKLRQERDHMENEINRYRRLFNDRDVNEKFYEVDSVGTNPSEPTLESEPKVNEPADSSGMHQPSAAGEAGKNQQQIVRDGEQNRQQMQSLRTKVDTLQQQLREMKRERKQQRRLNKRGAANNLEKKAVATTGKSSHSEPSKTAKEHSYRKNTGGESHPKAVVAKKPSEPVNNQNRRPTMNVHNKSAAYPFYVVAASFQNYSNTKEFKKKLVDEGYKSAQILQKKHSSIYLVAYCGYGSWQSAKNSYQQIVANVNKNAWVYSSK